MKRNALRLFLIVSLFVSVFALPAPKAEAMDPITISMLAAPIVIPMVKAAMPYILKYAANFGKGMLDVFLEMAGFLLLPLGMLEASAGAPLGMFNLGMSHMGYGAMAPFKMMWQMMLIPMKVFGFG